MQPKGACVALEEVVVALELEARERAGAKSSCKLAQGKTVQCPWAQNSLCSSEAQ